MNCFGVGNFILGKLPWNFKHVYGSVRHNREVTNVTPDNFISRRSLFTGQFVISVQQV